MTTQINNRRTEMSEDTQHNLLPVIAEPLIGGRLLHGFFTREGGVSKGIYRGLNTGLGSKDAHVDVLENRNRIAAHFGVPTTKVAGCFQVHSPDVVTVDDNTQLDERPQADALVTRTPDLVISIQTADCGPVLFADAEAGVIGAAHAGWKGATGGVLANTVQAMENLGAERTRITAVLGPTISQTNYEVGPEFVEHLHALNKENERYFAPSKNEGHVMFDLAAYIVEALADLGVSQASWTGHCTYADEDRFFSYRRTTHRKQPDYGRQMSAIMLR
ncbi:MAG: peptidoglycan editing factor PgeF [Pseudomonadota bacterium]